MTASDPLTKPPTPKNQPGAAKGGEGDGEEKAPESRAAWLMGWVIGPGAVLGLIFGGGVLLGAHLHESWFARLVMWTVGLFS